MSIFSSILEKLGFDQSEDISEADKTASVAASVDEEEEDEDEEYGYEEGDDEEEEYEEDDEEEYGYEEEYDGEMNEVDVLSTLEALAEESDEDLNWRESIVDLLKLLELDSSLSARKELARELRCPAKKIANSAQMNMWLHKTVLQKLAANGGNIPEELLE